MGSASCYYHIIANSPMPCDGDDDGDDDAGVVLVNPDRSKSRRNTSLAGREFITRSIIRTPENLVETQRGIKGTSIATPPGHGNSRKTVLSASWEMETRLRFSTETERQTSGNRAATEKAEARAPREDFPREEGRSTRSNRSIMRANRDVTRARARR